MRAAIRTGIVAACATAAMAVPAAASAKVVTYGGTVGTDAQNHGDPGRIALDVKVSRKGAAKKVVGLRAANVVTQCDHSGEQRFHVSIDRHTPVNTNGDTFGIMVKKSGAFHFSVTDQRGLRRVIAGRFSGRKDRNVAGDLTYEAHFPAEGDLPAENCRSGKQPYSAKRGGPDVPVLAALRR